MKLIHFFSAAAILCLVGSASACDSKERRNDPATEYVQEKCRWVGALRCSAPNLTSLPICDEGLVLTAAGMFILNAYNATTRKLTHSLAAGGPSCCCPPV